MARKEEWITGKEAAAILSARSGYTVKQSYVRYLAYKAGKVAYRERDGRTSEYLRKDVERITVKQHAQKSEEASNAA